MSANKMQSLTLDAQDQCDREEYAITSAISSGLYYIHLVCEAIKRKDQTKLQTKTCSQAGSWWSIYILYI